MLGNNSPTVLGEGMVEPSRRKRPVNQLPDPSDFEMPVDPERRIRRKQKPVYEGQVPTILNY